MCALVPIWLAALGAVWWLQIPLVAQIAWDALLIAALFAVYGWMRRPVAEVGGVPIAKLPGYPCPVCDSTQTDVWRDGRRPIGLLCRHCRRRTGAGALREADARLRS